MRCIINPTGKYNPKCIIVSTEEYSRKVVDIIMQFSEAWKYYERDKQLEGYSRSTLKGYKLQYGLLADYYPEDLKLGDFDRNLLKEYLVKQVHLKPNSIAYRIKFIRSFFRWAVDEGYINKNPAVSIKEPKTGIRVPKFLTEEDIEYLRDACYDERSRAIFEFLYNTGCRIGEVVTVNILDIDWGRKALVVMGKGNKEREVYFTTKCSIHLKRYIESRKDDCPALFATVRRPYRRISIDQMRYILKKVAKKSGIEANVYPHRLRHSFATHLLDNGAPMEVIQQMLGHSKMETTQIYAQLSGEHRRRMYKKYFH